MCGIFGSKDYERYVSLYKINKERGDFSFGGLLIDNKLHAVLKTQGVFNFKGNLQLEIDRRKETKSLKSFKNYLGHTQAPTSSKRTYSHATTHPFECGDWLVAHNGVLSNYKKIAEKFKKSKCINEVDSSIIPTLINEYCKNNKDNDTEVECICAALSLLKGTFGLWIFNMKTSNVYIARCGSTLYADYLTSDFSSTKTKNFKLLDEGVLYFQTPEGLTSVGNFSTDSPFFTS